MNIEEINKKLFDCLINLDTFSRLSYNVDIHLSKTGYFVPTAGKLSSLPFAQTVSIYFNEYTTTQLVKDLSDFMHHIINLLYTLCDLSSNKELKLNTLCKIKLINREFKNADKGLLCLLNTYINTQYYNEISECIS